MSPFLSTLGGGSAQGFQQLGPPSGAGGGNGQDANSPAASLIALDNLGAGAGLYYVLLSNGSTVYGRCERLGTGNKLFMRVLHQYYTSLFSSQSDAYAKNTGDPRDYSSRGQNWTYSIMGNTGNMTDGNGLSEWYAVWEGISGYNQWQQTSNPLTTNSSVTGYVGINIDSGYGTWGGISRSDDPSSTEWDGHIGGSWWYSWGNYRNHSPYFPVAGNDKQWCDLWCRW